METDKLVRYGSIILGLGVIIASIWVILMPPAGDEMQGTTLMVIGFFMLAVVYYIMQLERKYKAA